jgi:hypothetical protein
LWYASDAPDCDFPKASDVPASGVFSICRVGGLPQRSSRTSESARIWDESQFPVPNRSCRSELSC